MVTATHCDASESAVARQHSATVRQQKVTANPRDYSVAPPYVSVQDVVHNLGYRERCSRYRKLEVTCGSEFTGHRSGRRAQAGSSRGEHLSGDMFSPLEGMRVCGARVHCGSGGVCVWCVCRGGGGGRAALGRLLLGIRTARPDLLGKGPSGALKKEYTKESAYEQQHKYGSG